MQLAIYDVQGRLVKVLAKGRDKVGRHAVTWLGRDSNEESVASGVYFACLTVGEKVLTTKLTLLR
jgi:flagellar hook assembly protein FlgD